ncbi:histidine kinase N-terminal domain-containing protein [Brooklawnia sp.]|uniref:sensor histidine kinase n=1 Tax=Brooklawnia sp. TaxID=2699740 RepID=UPI00311F1889
MRRLSEVMNTHCGLDEADKGWLLSLIREWHLFADTSFSDLVLWLPDRDDENVFWAGAQIRPTTGPTALEDDVVGEDIRYEYDSMVTAAFLGREIMETSDNNLNAGIPVDTLVIPVIRHDQCIAVIERHTNRMGVRAPGALEDTYLAIADVLSKMLWCGQFPMNPPSDPTASPRVGDGLMWVDPDCIVRYCTPNATSCIRKLGATGDLEGEDIRDLLPAVTLDYECQHGAVGSGLLPGTAWEVTVEDSQASVRLRILPLTEDGIWIATVVLCRDITVLRERERQLVTKDATIREIHHRVKNNLQTVAALLRLQSRRMSSPEGRDALRDAQRRVQSIAAVHEILSQGFDEAVPFDQIADRILLMVGDVASAAGQVGAGREGSFGSIPGDIATSLSLVMTELCQNAIEHGLLSSNGTVIVHAVHEGDHLILEVIDDGAGLPDNFDLTSASSLGLSIVTTLINDLGGSFSLRNNDDQGSTARVELDLPTEQLEL